MFSFGGTLSIDESSFIGGLASQGGAIFSNRGNLVARNSRFSNNRTTFSDGGAIKLSKAVGAILLSQFDGNESRDEGGAIFSTDGQLHVVSSSIVSSVAQSGAAIRIEAGDASLVSTLFSGNHALVEGGAISMASSSVSIVNATFSNNMSESSSVIQSTGDANGFPVIANSVFWNNASGDGYDVQTQTAFSMGFVLVDTTRVSVPFSSFGPIANYDPSFLNGEESVPSNNSQVLDEGSLEFLPKDEYDLDRDGNSDELLPLDALGTQRVVDNGSYEVDMGAIEADIGVVRNYPPVAILESTSVSGVAPIAITFIAAGSSDANGDQLTYSWDFGDGATGEGEIVSHTYTASGEYAVVLTASDGYLESLDSMTVFIASGVDTEAVVIPETHALNAAYPNPFNPTTTISYALPTTTEVQIRVLDMLGRQVASLVAGERMPAGHHTLQFDACGLSSGTYLLRMEAGDFVATQKLILLR